MGNNNKPWTESLKKAVLLKERKVAVRWFVLYWISGCVYVYVCVCVCQAVLFKVFIPVESPFVDYKNSYTETEKGVLVSISGQYWECKNSASIDWSFPCHFSQLPTVCGLGSHWAGGYVNDAVYSLNYSNPFGLLNSL